MTINPCCIPLKTGVRMVTHLSMALALAVGWTALKLISISSEVSLNEATTTTSTGVIKPSDPRAGVGSTNVFIEQQSPPPPPPQSFYNAHIFESHQVPPQYRIPYEYILYHKWHQQQQQILQQQQHYPGPGVEGYHHNLESQHHNQQQQQQQQRYYDDIFSSWYQQHQQQRQQHTLPSQLEREDGNGFESFSTAGPMPPPPPPPPLPPQEHHQNSQSPPSPEMTDISGYEDDDEQSKIFRSVLHHRKNFKGAGPPSSSLPTGDLSSGQVRRRNSTKVEVTSEDDDGGSRVVASTLPKLQLTSSSKLVQTQEEQTREREQVSKDRFSSSSPLPLFPLQNGKEKNSDPFSPATVASSSATTTVSPSQAQLSRSTVRRQQHQRRRNQHSSEQKNDEQENSQEMNRPRTMMMMMSKLSRENSQRDGVGYYGGISERGSSSSKKLLPDFKEQYAKTLLVCGLLALCTVVFQFLTSFLLLCFVDKGSNAAAQIWTAVHCSVIFCLATCLVLFLCEGLSMPKYIFDETIYLCLITIDSLLSIYFLWVVMAFI